MQITLKIAVVRMFHIYREVWKPSEKVCTFCTKLLDMFGIAMAKFFLKRILNVSGTFIYVKHRLFGRHSFSRICPKTAKINVVKAWKRNFSQSTVQRLKATSFQFRILLYYFFIFLSFSFFIGCFLLTGNFSSVFLYFLARFQHCKNL